MNYQPPVYLTPHLYMTNEEEEIIDALVDHHEMPKKFDVDKVISYFEGENFCLVLYFANLQDRGFQKFVVNDFSVNVEEMYMLSGCRCTPGPRRRRGPPCRSAYRARG